MSFVTADKAFHLKSDRLCQIAVLACAVGTISLDTEIVEGSTVIEKCKVQLESALSGLELGEDGETIAVLWNDICLTMKDKSKTTLTDGDTEVSDGLKQLGSMTRRVLENVFGAGGDEINVFLHCTQATEQLVAVEVYMNPSDSEGEVLLGRSTEIDLLTTRHLPIQRMSETFVRLAEEVHELHSACVTKAGDAHSRLRFTRLLSWMTKRYHAGVISTLAIMMRHREHFPHEGIEHVVLLESYLSRFFV